MHRTILLSTQCLVFVFPRMRFSQQRPGCGHEADQRMSPRSFPLSVGKRITTRLKAPAEIGGVGSGGVGGIATNVAAQLENKLPANAYTPPLIMNKTDDTFLCILVLS